MDKIIPISDLQTQAKKYVEQVRKTDQPVIVTQRGRAAVILMKFESYEGHVATQEEMLNPDWKKRLQRAQEESKRGKGVTLETYVRRRRRKVTHKKAV